MYLRLLTSVALHERREFFEPFVLVRALVFLWCLSQYVHTWLRSTAASCFRCRLMLLGLLKMLPCLGCRV